ncbi:hypothetical protein JZ751_016046 [Albula glossodonta]|uniref:Uncharacterized protein n=1 Tax=Albula glossodonta TaxID=121402 RepID=A0A8T2NQW4_9TELE|nr:hypothetical protein JZ751_016046 [Albula glossodonta]
MKPSLSDSQVTAPQRESPDNPLLFLDTSDPSENPDPVTKGLSQFPFPADPGPVLISTLKWLSLKKRQAVADTVADRPDKVRESERERERELEGGHLPPLRVFGQAERG